VLGVTLTGFEVAAAGPKLSHHEITVEHITIVSTKPFAETEAALDASVPQINPAIAEALSSGDEERARRIEHASELFIFLKRDHGSILRAAGQTRKALQYEIGNPLVATMMTRHKLPAALYAPLRVVLYENSTGGSTFEYDKPSTLFGQFDDEQVTVVARDLDDKLEHALKSAAD
jgi:uncharacterized protein (DUF302 family)